MALRATLFMAMLFTPLPALAGGPAGIGEHRLSAEQIDKVLRDAAAKREQAERTPAERSASSGLPIRAEIGFSVGTHGYRQTYGTALVPLGDGHLAAISVDTGRGRANSGPYPR